MTIDHARIYGAYAPGKIILSGEYSVIHGQPAIACAVNQFAYVEIEAEESGPSKLEMPQQSYQADFNSDQLEQLHTTITQRYQQFQSGNLAIEDVLGNKDNLIPFAVAHTQEYLKCFAPVHLAIDCEIPLGSGMGSSATISVAIIEAVASIYERTLTDEERFKLSFSCEQMIHGNPSGLDNRVAIHGGMLKMEKGKIWKLDHSFPALKAYFTGRPQVTTGECVSKVLQNFPKGHEIWLRFERTTKKLLTALIQAEQFIFRDAIRENHQLLNEIGVVPENINAQIAELESQGFAAKVCGAGAIRGPNAGIVICTGEPSPQLIKQFGWKELKLRGDSRGLRKVEVVI
ncbi:MAG: hypothetical protein MK193_02555 [Lentisphaeria bacterium]|nr:hypothetical protein [Lentisphaeria bacterium]